MKYYLVNYVILDHKTITENEFIGVPVYSFPSIDDFKKSIIGIKKDDLEIENMVIKSYKQISSEAFKSLNTAVV